MRIPRLRTLGWALCLGASVAAAGELSFSDVPQDHWAHDAVQVCAQLGIFDGFEGYEAPTPRPARLSPADQARAQIRMASERSVPAAVLPGAGIRPRLLDPLAERFAQEIERSMHLQQEAARIRLPPPPPEPARPLR